ncbi:SIR2-domain-containing protein [Ramaria rubella]|nr:SIR2-domain-containing protein [Ramaria rubella]
MALSPDFTSQRLTTHRDCPSKLPWNTQGSQDDDLQLDDSDDEDHLNLKTITMSREDVTTDQHLQAQFSEAAELWSDDDVCTMTEDAQEKGVEWWIKEYVIRRSIHPRKLLLAFGLIFSKEMPEPDHEKSLKILKMTLMRVVRRRERLTRYNTITDVMDLLIKSQRIMVLSGAGISVSSGIPDFRSKNGLYQMLKSTDEFDLDDPQQMFDLEFFKENPHIFYSFAKEIYPSNHTPSLAHRFIKLLENRQKLLRNYTQNIDDLESSAGIETVLQCHGSFSKATCLQCGTQFPGNTIEADVLAQRVPICKLCPTAPTKPVKKNKKPADRWNGGDESDSDGDNMPRAILKPNITFFGEKLTDKFDKLLRLDRDSVDLLIVMGTSLKVTPVSEILSHIPHSVPQILINKTPIKHMNADIVLLGNADSIVDFLCTTALGWELPPIGNSSSQRPSTRKRRSSQSIETIPKRVGNSHVWLFEGAEGGDFVANLDAHAQTFKMSKPSVDLRQPKKTRAI